jgi:hypothetical protein
VLLARQPGLPSEKKKKKKRRARESEPGRKRRWERVLVVHGPKGPYYEVL